MAVRPFVGVAAWAALYVVAAVAGRRTLEGGEVSLVWPAAGVGVLWLAARRRRGLPWADLALLTLLTGGVVAATGGSVRLAVLGAVAAAVQTGTAALLLARWCPRLWSGRARVALSDVDELWWLVLAAGLGALASTPPLLLALALETGEWSVEVGLLWLARGIVSTLTVVPLGCALGAWWRGRRAAGPVGATGGADLLADPPDPEPVARRPRRGDPTGRGRVADTVVALVVTPAVYVAWFLAVGDAALVFPLIALSVWIGARMRPGGVVLHTAAVSITALTLTLLGRGPFASLGTAAEQVAVAQLYVGLVTAIALSLSLARDERLRLLADLRTARDRARDQARLLGTIVDTMSEGVRVVDATGRVVVRNPTATRLLTGVAELDDDAPGGDLAGLARLDGTPLDEDDYPFRQALDGRAVRDVDLLVRTPASPQPRIVTFTAVPLPRESGGGAVTVLRDVTAERQELRRAAEVQASLLPRTVPDVPGYDLAASFVPVGSVGGDFYDWEPVPGGLALTLADVMGKGMGAAILAATTRSVLHAQPAGDVATAVMQAEKSMEDDLVHAGAFVTLFRAHVDLGSGTVAYADAGHGLTLVVRPDGTHERLPAGGPPLGLGTGPARAVDTARLGPGDVLVTFSDGVLDALGGSLEDLVGVADAVRGARSAADAVREVAALAAAADGQHDDDLTVLAVVRRAR